MGGGCGGKFALSMLLRPSSSDTGIENRRSTMFGHVVVFPNSMAGDVLGFAEKWGFGYGRRFTRVRMA